MVVVEVVDCVHRAPVNGTGPLNRVLVGFEYARAALVVDRLFERVEDEIGDEETRQPTMRRANTSITKATSIGTSQGPVQISLRDVGEVVDRDQRADRRSRAAGSWSSMPGRANRIGTHASSRVNNTRRLVP